MTSKWKKCRIGSLCDTISETYKGNNEYVVLINTSDVLDGEILNHESVANKNLKGQFKKTFKQNDILYSEIRPANKRFAFIDFDDTERYIASTKLMVLRPYVDVVLPQFLFAILKSKEIINELQLLAETRSGTFPQITFSSELAPMTVMLPDFDTQSRIVGILSAIEEKIKLNTAINENLEQQAQAIFDDIFPDIFVNPTSTFQEIITFSNGKKRPENIGNIAVYGGNGILSYTDKSNAENVVIIGRVGAYCGNVSFSKDSCWISDNAIQAKSKITESQIFIFYLLKNSSLSNRHIGSGQPLITQGILNNISFNCPPKQDVEKFINICEPFQNKINSNIFENQRLSALRDTLLPKLMSGEIDVSEVKI